MRSFLFLPVFLMVEFMWPAQSDSTGSGGDEPIVYFVGRGTDPSWTLELSLDEVVFQSKFQGFEKIVAPHVEPIKVMDSNVKRYTIVNDDMKMEIDLSKQDCQNPDSRERFNYGVEIAIKRKVDSTMTYFNGCGVYYTDSRLEGKWIASEIKGKPVIAADALDTLPSLELHAFGNAFSGHSGCNTVRGRIFSERTLLRFTDLVVTKRICPSAAREKEFINALEFSTQFKIEENKLILSNPGGVNVVLTKSD